MMLNVRLHYRSPRVVKLKDGLHHGYSGSDQKVSWSGEGSDGASP